jgi:hypothetical protein
MTVPATPFCAVVTAFWALRTDWLAEAIWSGVAGAAETACWSTAVLYEFCAWVIEDCAWCRDWVSFCAPVFWAFSAWVTALVSWVTLLASCAQAAALAVPPAQSVVCVASSVDSVLFAVVIAEARVWASSEMLFWASE